MRLVRKNLRKVLYRIFAISITVASILYLAHEWSITAGSQKLKIENYSVTGFIISLLAGLVHLAVMARIFSGLISNGQHMHNASIFLATQITKYAPGKIWPFLMQRTMLGSSFTTKNLITVNVVLAWITLGGLFAGMVMAILYQSFGFTASIFGAIGSCLIFGAPVIVARLFQPWLAKYEWTNAVSELTEMRVIFGCLAAWITSALSWFGLYSCALGYDFKNAISLYGITGFSIVAGMVSALPAGLGLREASIVWAGDALTGWTTYQLASIAIAARVWLLALDVLASLVGFLGIVILSARRSALRKHGCD